MCTVHEEITILENMPIRLELLTLRCNQKSLTFYATVQKKRGNMANASAKLNMPLSLHLSCTCGLGPQATTSYKRLASLLSAKWNKAYSLTIMWLRCRLAYSLLRSSVMCIRGARSHLGHYTSATQPPLDLVSKEALLLAQ